jgi:hypothetical protein
VTPADLLHDLRNGGFTLRHKDGRLLVGPSNRLTDAHRAGIREHRDALVALVEEEGNFRGPTKVTDPRPFVGPPPDDPAWIPAAAYHQFWAWVGLGSATAAAPNGTGGPPSSARTPRRKRGAGS